MQNPEERSIWVVMANSDNTEGRGFDYPIYFCATETTALRLARGRYVQGRDSPVRKATCRIVDGRLWLSVPEAGIYIRHSTAEDDKADSLLRERRAALERAKTLGLTEQDILLIKGE